MTKSSPNTGLSPLNPIKIDVTMNNILRIVTIINSNVLGGFEKNTGVANLPTTSAAVNVVIKAICYQASSSNIVNLPYSSNPG